MPFTVQQLIESHQEPITVSPLDTAQKALALMAQNERRCHSPQSSTLLIPPMA